MNLIVAVIMSVRLNIQKKKEKKKTNIYIFIVILSEPSFIIHIVVLQVPECTIFLCFRLPSLLVLVVVRGKSTGFSLRRKEIVVIANNITSFLPGYYFCLVGWLVRCCCSYCCGFAPIPHITSFIHSSCPYRGKQSGLVYPFVQDPTVILLQKTMTLTHNALRSSRKCVLLSIQKSRTQRWSLSM